MLALAQAKLLQSFHTSLAVMRGGALDRVTRFPGLGELRRREFPQALRPMTHSHPAKELLRLASLRFGWHGLIEHERGILCVERVYAGIDQCTAEDVWRSRPGGVYCYEDGALATFRAAQDVGAKRIYDLPIGYWRTARRILSEEAERRPDWRATLGGLRDSEAKLARKEEELSMAELVLVASSFTKKTLEDCPFPVSRVLVIPYGADELASAAEAPQSCRREGPLKVLFVGGLSQRKGIADLFEAVALLGSHVELTVIGRKPAVVCAPLEAALHQHRWIDSMPREQILAEMRAHDVFVFPSLFEGFGLVVTEALSQGLPVITTPHTCGPDVLTEGEDGFIVPIRDPQAIAEKLELLHRDRDRLATMSEAARKKAQTLTWESYRQGIVSVVREVLASE